MITPFNSTQQNYNLRNNSKHKIGFGRRKIPQFLYHITTVDKWEKIKSTGALKTGNDPYIGKGVFMIDLPNFLIKWTNTRVNCDFGYDVYTSIINWIQRCDKSPLVLLRIKTNKLSKNQNLSIRELKPFFEPEKESESFFYSKIQKKLADAQIHDIKQLHKFRRTKAIECIYKNEIPIENIQLVKESDNEIKNKFRWTFLLNKLFFSDNKPS